MPNISSANLCPSASLNRLTIESYFHAVGPSRYGLLLNSEKRSELVAGNAAYKQKNPSYPQCKQQNLQRVRSFGRRRHPPDPFPGLYISSPEQGLQKRSHRVRRQSRGPKLEASPGLVQASQGLQRFRSGLLRRRARAETRLPESFGPTHDEHPAYPARR